MSKSSAPSHGPANIGMSTVHRTPNGGLLTEEYRDLRATSEAVKADAEASAWIAKNQKVWLQHGRYR